MSFVPRATLIVASAAAAAALATTSTAAETTPSGGASLTAGAPAPSAAPTAAPTLAPALPAPADSKFSGSTVPSGGVALLPLAHIAARLAQPRSDGTHKTWTVRVDGRQLTFDRLARR